MFLHDIGKILIYFPFEEKTEILRRTETHLNLLVSYKKYKKNMYFDVHFFFNTLRFCGNLKI